MTIAGFKVNIFDELSSIDNLIELTSWTLDKTDEIKNSNYSDSEKEELLTYLNSVSTIKRNNIDE